MESETKEFVQLVRLYAVKEKELPYGKKELNDSAKVVELWYVHIGRSGYKN